MIFLTLYEPRWHGFARWELRQETPLGTQPGILHVLRIKIGWWRPPRNWRYQRFDVSS